MASGQNRPERNPSERPGSDVLARRANRDAGYDAAVRPHGRMRDRPRADISPATREAEQGRPSGTGRHVQRYARPLTFSPEAGAIAQASQAMQEANKEEGVCSMTPTWPEITESNQVDFTLLCPILQKHCI